MYLERT